MAIFPTVLQLSTDEQIGLYDVTAILQTFIDSTQVQQGQVLVFSHH